MINDVYECGCVRNFTQNVLTKMNFDLELKGHENGFCVKTEIFLKMKRFYLKTD